MQYNIDPKFINHFHNLQQVFLYITDRCNLRCVQCLYKPNLVFCLDDNIEIELDTALALISDFRELGAIKLNILGGEPTLYGLENNNKPLLFLIDQAKKMGYGYLRLDTNGTFNKTLLAMPEFAELDEIAFSLDGFNRDLNDPIRGNGTFNKCVANIINAVQLGYNVSITCCIHKGLMKRDNKKNILIDKMIRFAESLGVNTINFHDLFKVGVPMDIWTGDLNPSILEWVNTYKLLRTNIFNREYGISVRLPLCFVSREEFAKKKKYYGYCPAKMGERVMVHPNGIIRICSNLICTPYGVAKYIGNKILWDEGPTNELNDHNLIYNTPCTNRGKKSYGEYVPLCFSFKPEQKEIVWEHLKWDKEELIINSPSVR